MCFQNQNCTKRIVDCIDQTAEPGEAVEINRAVVDIGVHAARRRIDNDLCICVLCAGFFVGESSFLSGAADFVDLCSAKIRDHGICRFTGTAGSQDQDFFTRRVCAVSDEQIPHSEIVGIVSAQLSVPVDDGVYRTNLGSLITDFIKIGDHGLFVGNRNVDSPESCFSHERIHFMSHQLVQIIVVGSDFLVNDLRKTVGEMFPDKSILHLIPPDCYS